MPERHSSSWRRLEGRTAIVTGGARGIGQAYARRLAEEGANIVVADIRDAAATTAMIEALNGSCMSARVDVTDGDQIGATVTQAIDRFGRIDILINNAAMMAELVQDTPFESIDEAEWDQVMAVNVKGPWLACREVVPYMRERGAGRIINVSSVVFFIGTPLLLHYCCSKGAVVALTRSLASELEGTGITVNAIAPGLTFHPHMRQSLGDREQELRDLYIRGQAVKRSERPDDLVGTVAFLASDDSEFMSGQTLLVDGGYSYH